MFISKQRRHQREPRRGEPAQILQADHFDEQGHHGNVAGNRAIKRGGNAEALRKGMDAHAAVKINILTGVNQVESSHPEGHGGAQQQHTQTDVVAQGNPGGDGSKAVRDPQHQVREQSEALGVGVEEQDGNRQREKA